MSDWVAERKISQFRDGSRGRLSNQDGGIPVNSRAARKPDFLRGGESFKLMPNGAPQVVQFSLKLRFPFSVASPIVSLGFLQTRGPEPLTILQYQLSTILTNYSSNQSRNCGVKYDRMSVAPARTILSVVSNAITRKSYTPARAPATTIAYSPLTWYAASG